MKHLLLLSTFAVLLFLGACDDDPDLPNTDTLGDLEQFPYDPQPYTIVKPAHYPAIPIPANNPMTQGGVQLGRHLFYDNILSANGTMSCSSCHLPSKSFTDGQQFSTGIDGIKGTRNAMSLMNIAYVQPSEPGNKHLLFWDGRSASLEDQALLPVEDPIELHNLWPNIIEALRQHPTYPQMFREAFGIKNKSEITKELAAKALAQFERILIGSGTSIYERSENGEPQLLQDEALDGKLIFFDEGALAGLPDGECFHCHGSGTLTGGNFFNNGLDSFELITDIGLEAVTGNTRDRGSFRAPTLLNIALTSPYMHDGRFGTLEQVIDQYLFDVHTNQYSNPNLHLMAQKKAIYNAEHRKALVAFLKTLTDTTFINNPDIQTPF